LNASDGKKTAPAALTRGGSIGGGNGFARHDFYALKNQIPLEPGVIKRSRDIPRHAQHDNKRDDDDDDDAL
jgi:hypothetical protein